MATEELWRPVEDFPEYHISNYGDVVHVDRPDLIRKATINHRGFPCLVLFKKGHTGSRYLRQVNKLVADAYLERPSSSRMSAVWHRDGDFLNCHADNLMWEMRSRVMEWNDMHREGATKLATGRVMHNGTGRIYDTAFDLALVVGKTESEIIRRIENYAPYPDRAPYTYVD